MIIDIPWNFVKFPWIQITWDYQCSMIHWTDGKADSLSSISEYAASTTVYGLPEILTGLTSLPLITVHQ